MKTRIRNAFCWVELVAPDMGAAKRFYGGLYGWSFDDVETPGGPYSVIQTGNGMGGGIMPLPEGMEASWMPYVAVENLEETLALAEAAGGAMLFPPTDLDDSGRIMWIQDVEGARLGLYQAGPQSPPTLAADPSGKHHVCFVEETVADAMQATSFYSKLFSWEFESITCGGTDYQVIDAGVEPKGGFLTKPEPSMPSAWMPYVKVDDIEAALAAALTRGASLVVGRTEMEKGAFAVYADPHGAHLGIYQPPSA
ncbi:MAG TPA: VOC family protein [Planctomycetes bacterium]|nr:VOC family protein [Planctomycetota bacterium]